MTSSEEAKKRNVSGNRNSMSVTGNTGRLVANPHTDERHSTKRDLLKPKNNAYVEVAHGDAREMARFSPLPTVDEISEYAVSPPGVFRPEESIENDELNEHVQYI